MESGHGALAGLRIVEYGGLVAAAYCAKLLADLGADVVKVEPPTGDPARLRGPYPPGHEGNLDAGGLFIFLNANKRGVTLDLTEPGERASLTALLATADVFVHNCTQHDAVAAGIDDAALRRRFPRLIHTWITPFGLTGPYAGFAADELTVIAAGGWLSLSPGNAPDASYPPLKPFGHQAGFQTGTTAAVATLGALFARDQTGHGQLVDVSAQEVVGTELEVALARWTYARTPTRHFGAGAIASAPNGVARCEDGYIYIYIAAAQEHQWTALVTMMGDPAWAHEPRFADRETRRKQSDELRERLEAWTGRLTVEQVFDLAETARLPFAPVSTVGSLINSAHLQARGFFVSFDQPGVARMTVPGAPYRLSRTPWRLRRPAPRLGEHNAELLGATEVPS